MLLFFLNFFLRFLPFRQEAPQEEKENNKKKILCLFSSFIFLLFSRLSGVQKEGSHGGAEQRDCTMNTKKETTTTTTGPFYVSVCLVHCVGYSSVRDVCEQRQRKSRLSSVPYMIVVRDIYYYPFGLIYRHAPVVPLSHAPYSEIRGEEKGLEIRREAGKREKMLACRSGYTLPAIHLNAAFSYFLRFCLTSRVFFAKKEEHAHPTRRRTSAC